MKLSVFVVTYNQEKYIRQCLDSILMQKVDFDYEVVIGEDHGIDGTRAICEEYATKYPQVRLLPLKERLGIAENWKRVLGECRGEYIAMCEGDDYWTDEYKLKKQVDFLDSDVNFEYALCFHESMEVDENGNKMKESCYTINRHQILNTSDLMTIHNPPTHTLVFRKKHYDAEKHIFSTIPNNCITCDAVLCFLLGKHGKGFLIPNIDKSAYRIHGQNAWSSLSQVKMDMNLFALYSFLQPLENDYKEYYFTRRKSFSAKISLNAIKEHLFTVFIRYYFIANWLFLKSGDFQGIWNIQKGVIYNLIHK